MHFGHTELLGTAAGSALVESEVVGVSVLDTSRVIFVGHELSPGLLKGPVLLRYQDSLWFSLRGSGTFCMSLHQAFPYTKFLI